MASTSRTLFLLSLLVSGFCMTTVTANRSLQETGTNKLSLVDLDKLLLGKHGLLKVVLTVDLSEVLDHLEILVDTVDGLVKLDVLEGVVTKLKEPIVVKVSVSGKVNIVVKLGGKKVRVPLDLKGLDPLLETLLGTVEEVLHLVLKVVEGVDVLHIVNSITGELLGDISKILLP